MALYMMGDIQGCRPALDRLLDTVGFSPSRDTLYLLGDLVNRGPDSLGVLRWASTQGDAVRCVLGNHDLHLLAVAAGARRLSKKDTLADILEAPDRDALLHWLRQQPLARLAHGWLMVHAGVLPQWTTSETVALSQEAESASNHFDTEFLSHMYGDEPPQWHPQLTGQDRLRVIVNAFTRLRFCDAQGRMEFDTKESADQAPAGYMPWFDVPQRQTAGQPMAFGHWSTLGETHRADVLPLDSGCVWGGCLTAARLGPGEAGVGNVERISVRCKQAQKPGKENKTPKS
ncbi:diadenosine tetraphosphatase [Hydrogenophaga soli]